MSKQVLVVKILWNSNIHLSKYLTLKMPPKNNFSYPFFIKKYFFVKLSHHEKDDHNADWQWLMHECVIDL